MLAYSRYGEIVTAWTFESPGGLTAVSITLDDEGRLFYSIARHGSTLLEHSRLGLLCDDRAFAERLVLTTGPTTHVIDETYALGHGKRASSRVLATCATIEVANAQGQPLAVEFRVSDDTAGFRYRLLGAAAAVTLDTELTTFSFAQPGRTWMQPTSPADGGGPAHENLYANALEIGAATEAASWDLPAVFETQGQWALISESDLDRGFRGTRLGPQPEGREYSVTGPVPEEGMGHGDVHPTSKLPWTMPWRFVALADSAPQLLESTAVWDLASPSVIEDASWVKPGRVAWSWWSENDSPRDLLALRRFIDLAAEFGWEYSLVDANWTVHSDAEIRDLVAYAAEQNVRLFLWYNSAGTNNDSTEGPRDLMQEPGVRRAEMAKIAGWGIAGIKVDFFHSDKQQGIQHYLGILEDAADAGLIVNFHGCTIPRGWDRTWPNLLTMEAVRGAEWYLMEPRFAQEAVWHNTILPFTRNVIGSMDYTPVTFSDKVARRLTTAAHELALSVVFESALQHFADAPQAYRTQSEPVRRLLSEVPVVWDETIGLAGEPGDSVVLARRSGESWWIAGINGDAPKDAAQLDLTRLGDLSGQWEVFSDGDSRDDIAVMRTAVDAEFTRPALGAGGGFTARLIAS